jgi:hypothetical protein
VFPVRQVFIALRSALLSEACSLFDKCLLCFGEHVSHTNVERIAIDTCRTGNTPQTPTESEAQQTLVEQGTRFRHQCRARRNRHLSNREHTSDRQVSIALRSTLVSEACSLFDKCLLRFALHWCLMHVPCSTSVYCTSLYIAV